MPRRSVLRQYAGLLWIGLASGGTLAAIAPVDYAWTLALAERNSPGFVGFMRRTVFEGDAPGMSDIGLALVLACAVAYVLPPAWSVSRRLVGMRPVLGYVMVVGLAAGGGVVHPIKWLLGRPRPSAVFGANPMPYSEWYQLGANAITAPTYVSSFPSGHTATMCVLIAFAYALHGAPPASRGRRAAAWVLGACVLLLAAGMGIASSMSRSHWLSDAIGGAGLIWFLAHLFYHRVLRVADQQRLLLARPGAAALPRYAELRLCLWGFLEIAGILSIGLGLRAIVELPGFAAPMLIAAGAAALLASHPRASAIVRRLHETLDSRIGRVV